MKRPAVLIQAGLLALIAETCKLPITLNGKSTTNIGKTAIEAC